MNRRDFLRFAGAVTAAAVAPNVALAMASSVRKKPNFCFILIDDMGWRDATCYGSSFYETPNIDKLAASGMRFTNAYAAAPVCSPTRASILTGKYPARLHLTDWLGPDTWRAMGKLKHAQHVDQMPLEEVTIAEALKEAGYATASIGKWHLGEKDYYPEHQGFDINVAGNHSGFPPSYFNPYKWKHYSLDLPGGKEGEYLTDRLTDEAVEFIDKNKDKPFFLYLSHYAVHTPLQAKQEMTAKYQTKAENLPQSQAPSVLPEGSSMAKQVQDHAVYAAMVQSVDESVGRVIEKLKQLKLQDDTVIIFMSDNGGLATSAGRSDLEPKQGPTSNVPLRAGKGWLYEGGIREPMIICWPGVTKAASVCDEPVISTDFYPTMLEMAHLPMRPQQHRDGVSLVPVLKQAHPLKRDAIYFHYPHYSNQGGKPAGAVRAGDYKLLEFYEDNHFELYNLADDIGEKNNLAEKKTQKVAQLRDMLYKWRKSVDARMPLER